MRVGLWVVLGVLLSVWGCATPPAPTPVEVPSGPALEVRFMPPVEGGQQEAAGNLILLFSEQDYGSRPDWPGPFTIYGGVIGSSMGVRLKAGERVSVPLPELKAASVWTVCAYIDEGRDFMQRFSTEPGDWFSGRCLKGPEIVDGAQIVIDRVQSERVQALPAWLEDHSIEVQGRDGPKTIRFLVGLPPGYEAAKAARYPVLYISHGFNGTRFAYMRELGIFHEAMVEAKQEMILVSLEAEGPYGHHLFVNSEANGPMQDAFETSIVPWIDQNYRTRATREGRAVWGHSSGGWTALSLLLNLPHLIGHGFATSPDPIHLRPWWFHHPTNAYLDAEGRERLLIDIPGRFELSFRDFIHQEIRTGSFGQFFGFVAVYSPFTPSNAEVPFALPFDLMSGEINPEVWKSWAKGDLYLKTKADPDSAREALSGRFHLYVGDKDEFGLYPPAREYSELLDEMGIDHTFEVFEGASHGSYVKEEAFLRALWAKAHEKMSAGRDSTGLSPHSTHGSKGLALRAYRLWTPCGLDWMEPEWANP